MKRSGTILSRFVMGVLAILLVVSSCKHEVPQPDPLTDTGGNGGGGTGGGTTGIPCDSDSVYFNMQILPMLISNCSMSGCHDAGSHQDGVVLTSYSSVMSTGEVTPFDPGDSDLLEVLTESDPDKRMPPPPAAPLSSQQIQMIQTWIAQGAKNLNCDGICDTTNVTWTNTIRPIIQAKCQGCHQGGSPGGGVDLSNYAGVSGAAFSGELVGTIDHLPGFSAMPKNSPKLPDCDIAKIKIWVNAGAPNN